MSDFNVIDHFLATFITYLAISNRLACDET